MTDITVTECFLTAFFLVCGTLVIAGLWWVAVDVIRFVQHKFRR